MVSVFDREWAADFDSIADFAPDYIVIGGGAYGTAFAHRALRQDANCRVLILEKGDIALLDHIQNIPSAYVGLNSALGIKPWSSTGDMDFMPQVPYLGGRALLWNAWTPQPTPDEMPDWPVTVVDDLKTFWPDAASYLGRTLGLATAGNHMQALDTVMTERLYAGLPTLPTAGVCERASTLPSAMAVRADGPAAFAKFAPVSRLVDDAQVYRDRLKIVLNSAATRLVIEDGAAVAVETVNGNIACSSAKVILALSTIEAGALMVESLPTDTLVGKNLSGHIRSFLALRVPVDQLPIDLRELAVCAYYIPGYSREDDRFFHTHISVVFNPYPDRDSELLYKLVPDASSEAALATYSEPAHVVFMLHAMGEFLGDRSPTSHNYVACADGRTVVNVSFNDADERFWQQMDQSTYQVAGLLTGGFQSVEYQQSDGSWSDRPPISIRNSGLVHEAGTLWMGDRLDPSVTDTDGRMRAATNVFGTGSMLFPRPGSWNPTYTGIAMAFRLADTLVSGTPKQATAG